MSCQGCVWFYEEKDVNWKECKHPDHTEEDELEECKDYYSKEDAKADSKYREYDKYQEGK